ncbi:MAG: TetR/AcrR family transcriptional regulator [Bradyrhizobium sp.]|uniref:TetR/AcrR family transcriptional regulator n=1 Tax=Bradyrhizobium sp. TaxID=376 RepID=UPI0025B89BAD|nr:TetR/AcrR family transcriptional regulator [Bradyrhizobium sp.]MBI5261848.1 TetR/AcrR family transcriptional regulator [Bradyrhizobium sp.]
MRKKKTIAAPKRRWGGEVFLDDAAAGKRHAIMRAAARLFRERGYERTRLTDIADALNVSKPSLYYHLGDKEGILIAIQQFGLDQMLDGFDLLVDRGATGAELLRILLTRYGEWTTTEFGVCVITSFNIKISPRGAKSLHSARRLLERKVRALIERGVADRSIRPCNPALAATALFGCLNWMAFWYDRSRARRSAAEISAQFVDYFLSGLNGQETQRTREPGLHNERKVRQRE